MMDALDKEADGKGAKGPDGETLGGSEEGKGLLERLEGRRVRVTGVFDHAKEVLVGGCCSVGFVERQGCRSMLLTHRAKGVYDWDQYLASS